MQKILHLIGVQDSIAVLTKIGTFRQIGKGVGGMAGVSRGLWCDLKNFFAHFFRLNASGRNAIVQSRYKSSDSMALSFSAKVFSECAKV